MSSTTPNMGLTEPTPGPGGTPGPTWAQELNSSLSRIDEHDHTPGKGIPIPQAAIIISGNFSFNSFSLTDVRSTRYTSQGTVFVDAADINSVYVVNGELYYRDASGNNVQITSGGSVNVSGTGGITGMTGTTAAVTYSDSTKTFSFTQDAGITAKMFFGQISIAEEVASANSITIKSPTALGASYDITLPIALPASTLPVVMSGAGVLSTQQIVTAQIGDSQITTAKLAAGVANGLSSVVAALDDFAVIADTSDSGNIKKAVISSFKNSKYRSIVTSDSLSITADEFASLSGASFILTLPTAIGNAGKQFVIQHNGTSLTQVYTLNTTSGQTIGGIASGQYALYTNGETLTVISDGANWLIQDHVAQTDWAAAVASTITGSTSNPTKGTMTRDNVSWRRDGMFAHIYFDFAQSGAGSAGSGNYLVLLPGGLTADSTLESLVNTTNAPQSMSYWVFSTAGGNLGGSNPLNGGAFLYDTTHFCISGDFQGANSAIWGSGANSLGNATVNAKAHLMVKIVGWRP